VHGSGSEGAQAALARVELLRDLEPEALARLAAVSRHRSWRAGERVVRQDEPGRSLIVLVTGTVTVYRETGDGSRAALAHLRAPTTLGEVTLFDGAPRTATIQAVEPCTGLELVREDLLTQLADDRRFLDALLRALGGLVRRLSDQAADQLLLDLPGRVAKTLVVLAAATPGGQVVHLSQARIAELAGGTRQSLNQVLRRFADRGLVRVESGGIVVLDLDGLRRRAGLALASRA
jgi:CRP/FNR family cyclic AMP-dependent transcriptional regulator